MPKVLKPKDIDSIVRGMVYCDHFLKGSALRGDPRCDECNIRGPKGLCGKFRWNEKVLAKYIANHLEILYIIDLDSKVPISTFSYEIVFELIDQNLVDLDA